MSTVRINAIVQANGELRLTGLPFREGEPVEAIVRTQENVNEKDREVALAELLELAKRSKFRSTGPYPTREELHERR